MFHKPFRLDESTGELSVFFVISLSLYIRIYTNILIIPSILSLFQALTSYRVYLLTARIPTKVGTTICFFLSTTVKTSVLYHSGYTVSYQILQSLPLLLDYLSECKLISNSLTKNSL